MITVKDWKDIVTFDPISAEGVLDVDGTISRIAKVRCKPVAEVEATTAVEDLLPEYIKCVREVNSLVYKKLEAIPKNAGGDSQ